MFKVGDEVEWESQAGGFYGKVKRGIVLKVIPARRLLQGGRGEAYFGFQNHIIMFDIPLSPRSKESYLVEVRDGKTDKAMPKLYWPRVKWLRKVGEVKEGKG